MGTGRNFRHSRDRAWQKQQKTLRDMRRRTRRSESTIGIAAPDTTIGRVPTRIRRERVPTNTLDQPSS